MLWTDFRDVYFQRDPFLDFAADAAGADIVFFGEHLGKPLNDEGFTRAWVQACYGEDALDGLPVASPVLCSSNVMGTGEAVLGYLQKYIRAVSRMAKANPKECVMVVGVDQGHHSHLVYKRLGADPVARAHYAILPRAARVPSPVRRAATPRPRARARYDAGPVYTGGVAFKNFKADVVRDEDGFVLRSDGRRAALVHQYDRDDEGEGNLYSFFPARAAALAEEP